VDDTEVELGLDLQRLAVICRRYGIARIEVFGSAARGEAGPGSDVDLLYELQPGARLGWDIECLSDELSELFERPVDLVSRLGLHAMLRPRVLHDAKTLYAA